MSTFAELVEYTKAANLDRDQKAAAVADANAALGQAESRVAAGTAAMKDSVAQVGRVFYTLPDGSLEIYEPDGSERGYHIVVARGPSTPVPVDVAALPAVPPSRP